MRINYNKKTEAMSGVPQNMHAHEGMISIIVPCYNAEKYIDRCMRSLVNQTVGIEKMEIILINDASTDGTYNKLLAWEQQYCGHILLIDFEENSKQGRARNVGMRCAAGEYIAFVDADDWVEPTMCEILLAAVESGDYDFAQGWVVVDDREKYLAPEKRRITQDFSIHISSVKDRKQQILQRTLASYLWNKLYRKDFLINNRIMLLEDIMYEDAFFLGLLNLYAENVICVGECVYHYFDNKQGVTKQRNTTYYLDFFEMGSRRLTEYKNRHIFDEYKDELDYEYLKCCYVEGMKRLIKGTDRVPYEFFRKLQKQVVEAVPDYGQNPYAMGDEDSGFLLDLLGKEVPEDAWYEIEKLMHAIW